MKLFALLAGAASAENLLYCIYAGGHTNPNALPNNMCCPFLEQPGVKGKPYHAAIHGCCGQTLYDLNTQDCCVDTSTVIDQGANMLLVDPSSFHYDSTSFDNAQALLWNELGNGNRYKMELVKIVDPDGETVTDELASPLLEDITDAAFTIFGELEVGHSYTVKVTVINCMGDESVHGADYTFTAE